MFDPKKGDDVIVHVRGRVRDFTAGNHCIIVDTDNGPVYLPVELDQAQLDPPITFEAAPSRSGNVRVIGGAA